MNPLARLALWIMAAFVAGVMALAPASAASHRAHGSGHVQHAHAATAPAPATVAVAEAVVRAAVQIEDQSSRAPSLCHEGTCCAGAAPCCGALWPSAHGGLALPAPVFGRVAPPGPPFARGFDPSGLLRPPKAFA